MIDLAPLASFVLVSAVVILVPGSDVLLLIRSSMEGGQRLGFATFTGIHVGNLVLTTLVASGLGAIVSHDDTVMKIIQVIGGLYLLWLAYGAARSVAHLWAARADTAMSTPSPDVLSLSPLTAFTRGLVTNLTNPKVLIFYVSFFPQFLGHASSTFAQLELLAWVFIVLAMIWEGAVVVLAARMQHLMQRRTFALSLDALCVVVFTVLAAVILVEAVRGGI